jgi:UDP-N-acetylglucosamine diphosphorylase / glucose-1-phosphate thymidylyltransferase / UDP-N-acetylgalactosamine diphosphorylase / glucosamine-1-phosphate N-acetyltransferase / galactosamine-1-phosphate N-acetyltransferase
MPDLRIFLFDDAVSAAWEPFALTRPGGELRFGAFTVRQRAERVFGGRVAAHLSADHLQGFEEPGAAAVIPYDQAPAEGERLFLAARAVPAWGSGELWRSRRGGPGPLLIGTQVVGWYAPAGTQPPPRAWFEAPESHLDRTGAVELPGRTLAHVWELMSGNGDQVVEDVAALFPDRRTATLPAGVHQFGDHPVILGDGARVEPGVVLDTRAGPIWLDDQAEVKAFTRMAGPAYVGKRTIILGGTLETFSTGEVCRIRGEFASSVCLSWVNKAHDGHIGHAYLGAWVNLGAETTNSDLKNNYGTVKLWTPSGAVDTGEMKVGSFLGDHVKTGIGLLLNTGTVVGAGSNVYGNVMPPTHVPPFSWGTGDDLSAYRVDRFLETAERAMSRRSVPLSDSLRAQLQRAWERGRSQA